MRKLYFDTLMLDEAFDQSDQALNPRLLHVLPGSTLHSTPTFIVSVVCKLIMPLGRVSVHHIILKG